MFLILSRTEIGLKVQKNLTLEPVISKINNIKWNEDLNMWVLPADINSYKNALRALPIDLPNLQIDIDPIPDFLLDNVLLDPQVMVDDPNIISDMELKLVEFIESPIHSKLTDFQRDGVRLGIERRGRILFGNENGLGMHKQGLALASVYQEEWPAIIMCDKSMCETWKEEVMSFLDLESDEICVIDDMDGPLFRDEVTVLTKRKRPAPPPKKTTKTRKIKAEPKPVKLRKTYAERLKNLRENGYDSDSSESSDSDTSVVEEPNESDREPLEEVYEAPTRSNIKIYIASHKKVSNNKSKIMEQGFKVMICDGSHYLKNRDVSITYIHTYKEKAIK